MPAAASALLHAGCSSASRASTAAGRGFLAVGIARCWARALPAHGLRWWRTALCIAETQLVWLRVCDRVGFCQRNRLRSLLDSLEDSQVANDCSRVIPAGEAKMMGAQHSAHAVPRHRSCALSCCCLWCSSACSNSSQWQMSWRMSLAWVLQAKGQAGAACATRRTQLGRSGTSDGAGGSALAWVSERLWCHPPA